MVLFPVTLKEHYYTMQHVTLQHHYYTVVGRQGLTCNISRTANRRHLGFLKSRNFIGWRLSVGPRRITVRNFVKIDRSIVEVLRFLIFQNGQCRHLGFFEIAKFYWLLGWRGSRRISILKLPIILTQCKALLSCQLLCAVAMLVHLPSTPVLPSVPNAVWCH